MKDSAIFRALQITGKVLSTLNGESTQSYDWVYCRGHSAFHSQPIDAAPILELCKKAKHVAVVYHTKQTGLFDGKRFHHKKRTLDDALRSKLVTSKMFGRFYVATLSNENAVFDWKFITSEDLAAATMSLIPKIPNGVSSIVAMHRSGTVAAALLSAVLHVPCHVFSKTNGLIELGGGNRTTSMRERGQLRLVVDDTVLSGKSMAQVKDWLTRNDTKNRHIYAAIFATPHGASQLDLFAKTLRTPHLLEWNFLNCTHGKHIAVDLDGVLCFDPPHFDETKSDGRDRYLEWIKTAKVRYPSRFGKLSAIVSYRCEYTRAATEAWLEENGIRFNRLHLFPGRPEERTYKAAQHKGRFYKTSQHRLFVESSTAQARGIHEYTRKPVLDIETRQMYGRLS